MTVTFINLPGEIRNAIYDYLLPTPKRPLYLKIAKARGRPTIQRKFPPQVEEKFPLSLYSTCRTIHSELPTLHMLLESGALVPTIDPHLVPFPEILSQQEFDAYLQSALVPASKLRFDLEEDWIWAQRDVLGESFGKCRTPTKVDVMMDVWLKGDGTGKTKVLDVSAKYTMAWCVLHLIDRIDNEASRNLVSVSFFHHKGAVLYNWEQLREQIMENVRQKQRL